MKIFLVIKIILFEILKNWFNNKHERLNSNDKLPN